MSENCTTLTDQLIAERHRQGKTQRQIAEDAQLTQSVLARLEIKKAAPAWHSAKSCIRFRTQCHNRPE